MKFSSAWVDHNQEIKIIPLDLTEPLADEVVVAVRACGICGTDMHFVKDLPTGSLTPLGHELAGYIHQCGSSVTDIAVGTKVVVQNNVACNRCDACLNQKPQSCEYIQTYMDDRAGMAEYLVVPRTMVIPFDGLDYPEATLAEPITVSLDLIREAAIELFADVLIMGPGIIGLCCAKLAKLRGALRVVVVGHNLHTKRGRYRSQVAYKLGADLVVDSSLAGWKERLKVEFPKGFKRVIITSPPATIADGIDLAGFGGWIVYDGIDFTDDTVTIAANDFHFSKKRLIASHAIPNWGFPQAIELLTSGLIPPNLLLTHRFRMSDGLEEAFAVFSNPDEEVIKPVVLIS